MLLMIWPSTRFLTSSCQPLHFYYLGCHRFHHCTSYPDVRCSFDPDDRLSRGGWISGINQVNGSQLYTQLGQKINVNKHIDIEDGELMQEDG